VEKLHPVHSISDERRNKAAAEREADADGGDQQDQAFRAMEMVNLVSNKMCSFSRISPVSRLASWSPPQASPSHSAFRAVSED
jgi:hypothetical protein